MSRAGVFISLEGGEGAGKSTQVQWLLRSLLAAGVEAIATREPGGCDAAEQIRALLVSGETDRWLPESEVLLLMAARNEHLQRVIRPAINQGQWVICDRFLDSTLVYQGLCKGLGENYLIMLHRLLFGSMLPDVTFFLDIPAAEGLARTQNRSGAEARFESLPLAFHESVRNGFAALAQRYPQRIITLDASCEAAAVHHALIAALNDRFTLSLAPAIIPE